MGSGRGADVGVDMFLVVGVGVEVTGVVEVAVGTDVAVGVEAPGIIEAPGIVEPMVGTDGPGPGQGVRDEQSGEVEEIAVLELGHRGARVRVRVLPGGELCGCRVELLARAQQSGMAPQQILQRRSGPRLRRS